MKKIIALILATLLILTFGLFAMGSGEEETVDTGSDSAQAADENPNKLGNYEVVIDSCRLAKNYEGKDMVIIKYIYTNVDSENSAAFDWTFTYKAFQEGVELERTYTGDDNANYDESNLSKEIKQGVSLDIEVAYLLNDTTSDVEVEVAESISFNDKTITKTFTIA